MSVWVTVDDVIDLCIPDVISLGATATDAFPWQHSSDIGADWWADDELLLAGQYTVIFHSGGRIVCIGCGGCGGTVEKFIFTS